MRKVNYWIVLGVLLLAAVVFSAYNNDGEAGKSPETSGQKKNSDFQHITPPPVPDQMKFAGEEVPLWNFDVRESLDREIMVNSFFHSQTLRFIKLAPRYFEIIEPILKRDSIPDDFKYLALAESGFDPKALSPAGAAGIWQFMKGTARENGLEVNSNVDERYNIEKATAAACSYLHESYAKYGDWTTVAASYNAGRNGVDRQIERQNETHYYNLLLNEETARYVFRILALKVILEDPGKYGFHVPKKELYPSIPVTTLLVDTPVTDFAAFAKKYETNYKVLKYFNPWLRDTYLNNASGKKYEIKIPKDRKY